VERHPVFDRRAPSCGGEVCRRSRRGGTRRGRGDPPRDRHLPVEIPAEVQGVPTNGVSIYFETTIDDYGEIWVNGEIDLPTGAFQMSNNPHGSCYGDSGGAAMWPANSPDEALVGVTSTGDDSCSAWGADTMVGEYLCWLAEVGVPTAVCPAG